MSNLIHARFGQFMTDAYNPSNIEVLFEFLNAFDEITLPDGDTYRLRDGRFEMKSGELWHRVIEQRDINYFLVLLEDMTPAGWAQVKATAKVDNLANFKFDGAD
jgi:hypothetical protein